MPLASGNVPVEYAMLDGGFRGTDQTVDEMRRMTTGKWGSRSPKIRALAINILRGAGVPEKNYRAEMVAIHNWVRDNVRYLRDVAGQETLCYPEEIAFNTMAGDCDDKSMLDAALLGAIGIMTRFKVLGVTPYQYSHVYLQAQLGNQWITLDPIMQDKGAGWEAPKYMRAIEKTHAPNLPEGTPMNRGTNGLGYVGDPRVVSHLEADPAPQAPARTPYVSMNSFLDNDAPIEQLSNNAPAFPMNQNVPPYMGKPVAAQMRANLVDMRQPRQTAQQSANEAAMMLSQEEWDRLSAEAAAMEPGQDLHGVYTPDQLSGLGANVMDAQPQAYMQRPAFASTPEGIDVQYGRNALVMRSDRGDRIQYRGLWAMNEKPPIRRMVQNVAGLGNVDMVRRQMLPGMGYLAGRSLSGPGIGDEVPVPVPVTGVPVAPTGVSKPALLAALAIGAFLIYRRMK